LVAEVHVERQLIERSRRPGRRGRDRWLANWIHPAPTRTYRAVQSPSAGAGGPEDQSRITALLALGASTGHCQARGDAQSGTDQYCLARRAVAHRNRQHPHTEPAFARSRLKGDFRGCQSHQPSGGRRTGRIFHFEPIADVHPQGEIEERRRLRGGYRWSHEQQSRRGNARKHFRPHEPPAVFTSRQKRHRNVTPARAM
jgi:hypothetical protein